MALELDRHSAQRYSIRTRRSLIAMVASAYFFRPFVVMAARALGPGPTRLRLVKLAHNLSSHEVPVEGIAEIGFADEHSTASQQTQRAA